MLRPVDSVSPAALAAGQRALVKDLAWGSVTGAFSGGVILVAFALSLGATPVQVGLLAAIPFLAQAAQLPATVLVERLRRRRLITVVSFGAARGVIGLLAVVPFLSEPRVALAVLIAAQIAIGVLQAVGGCAVNGWLHQLIPVRELGRFFARRIFWGTAVACVATLAAGALVEQRGADGTLHAYAVAFGLAALAGFVSTWHIARVPEPRMPDSGPQGDLRARLWAPFRDRNFRRLLVFMAAWIVASNLAAPFLTVYLIQQRGYPVTTVTMLWVVSQLANATTLYLWGRLSDRLSNKAVLAVALPVNFACMLALVFVDAAGDETLQLGLLAGVHVVLGVATGGIGLATGNLCLKLAPPGQGTPYLAAIGLVSALGGGIAPIAAGLLAQAFQASELSAVVRFASPTRSDEFAVVSFAHWEFLFALSALLGLYVMHALSRIDEGPEVSERVVVQAFALEAVRSLNGLSSIGGALGSIFAFDRLSERRKWWAPRRGPDG
ncbi:MAG: MFS transporter [Burkholderiales bacterium]|nr:MAG: MFS transporter [Burkholderiales bacterium]